MSDAPLCRRLGGGVSVSTFTPCVSPEGGGTAVMSVYVRQKSTMQSQKQWHFLSLTMVALFYNKQRAKILR